MKILVVCQYYDPEPFRIGDICRALQAKGHSVTVVTGQPNYPEGKIYPGYEKKNRRHEVLDGVQVHRCFTLPRKSGALHRFLNYYSFRFSSCRFVKKLPGDYDVVLVNIVADVIIALSPVLPHFLGEKTTLICSGILDTRLADVKAALQKAGIVIEGEKTCEDWRCIRGKRSAL